MELEDSRDEPSIYVGETARSLAERSAEHWKDFVAKDEDSHMYKHWKIHHKGEGEPNFKFEIVRFCKDALSRQVGEAVRISLRKNCLNSKCGYNRCNLTRLTIPEEEEASRSEWKKKKNYNDTEEVTKLLEGRGIDAIVNKIHLRAKKFRDEKRKRELEQFPGNSEAVKPRKTKKLRYEKLNSAWGLGTGELDRVQGIEMARVRFLASGPGDCFIGEGLRQTKIRIWSAAEVLMRETLRDILDAALNQTPDYTTRREGWKELQEDDEENVPVGWMTAIGNNTETVQVGEGGSMSEDVLGEGCIQSNKKTKNSKKNNKITKSNIQFGQTKINKFFTGKDIFNLVRGAFNLIKKRKIQKKIIK